MIVGLIALICTYEEQNMKIFICSEVNYVLKWLNCRNPSWFKDIEVDSAPCPVEQTMRLRELTQ